MARLARRLVGGTLGVVGATWGVPDSPLAVVDPAWGVVDPALAVVDPAWGVVGSALAVIGSASAVIDAAWGVAGSALAVIGSARAVIGATSGVRDSPLGVIGAASGVGDSASAVIGATSGVVDADFRLLGHAKPSQDQLTAQQLPASVRGDHRMTFQMTLRMQSLVAILLIASRVGAQASATKAPSRSVAPLTTAQKRAALDNPAASFWKMRAADTVVADVETSKGTFTVELIRDWAPHGVDRFVNLARAGYFDNSRFFRVVYGFIAQFGIAGNPTIASHWARQHIAPDSVRASNTRGTITFAQYKPTDRTTNVFVNLRDNPALDTLGFAPIGRVVSGMEILDSLYYGYGEIPASDLPLGNPKRLFGESNRYLDAEFPKLDRLLKITVRKP